MNSSNETAIRIHPNLVCWLKNDWPLPEPEEGIDLFLTASRLGVIRQVWRIYNPDKDYIEPFKWYLEKVNPDYMD